MYRHYAAAPRTLIQMLHMPRTYSTPNYTRVPKPRLSFVEENPSVTSCENFPWDEEGGKGNFIAEMLMKMCTLSDFRRRCR